MAQDSLSTSVRPLQAFNLELKGHWNTNSGKMLAESHLVAPSPHLAQNMARSVTSIHTYSVAKGRLAKHPMQSRMDWLTQA